jgi:short subunit dehydrogenase-like uncharacterized protein
VPRRIVLFGASGYTGRLVAEALVRAKVRPVLAGRSHQNLAALGVKLGKGLETVVADVAHPDSLLELIRPDDVFVSTVGPFVRFGRPAVEAAIYKRATYLDSCGEPPFIRSVFEELSPIAEQAGVALLPAFAYEFVAGNVAAASALEGLHDTATRVDVGYFLRGSYRGGISNGTRASAGGVAFVPHFAWRHGGLQTTTAGDRTRSFLIDGVDRYGLAIAAAEHITLPRLVPSLREVGVYLGGPRGRRSARLTSTALAAAAKVPGVQRAAGWVTRLPSGKAGPDAEQRHRSGSDVIATAYDADGRELRTVRLSGADPYTFTGEILAWAAVQLSHTDIDQTGAVGPIEAFGLGPLRDATAAAGLPIVED